MKKYLYILAGLLVATVSATAHPLGNFSINQYSRLEVATSSIKIRQVLDIAEIPTFQLSSEIDTDKNGELSPDELNAYATGMTPNYVANLGLAVNDQPIDVRVLSKEISLKPGAGNLPTLRIEWNLAGDIASVAGLNHVEFKNRNYTERVGWNEIVLNRLGDVSIFDSSAFGSGITDELKAYPQESLAAPLAERSVQFSFSMSAVPAGAKLLQNRDGHATAAAQKDTLASLIAVPEITPSIVFLGLLLAFGLGAVHAMSPGHGKTIVGAYLVGSRGTPRHAAFLGITVTITHTLGVFALGLITLFASNYILPERIMPFLYFVSGLLVFYMGVTLFKRRLFAALGWGQNDHHHSHDNDHTHDSTDGSLAHTHDGHTHTHAPPADISWRSLLALGIAGGLLPCPSALVLILSAISLGRVGYGLVLTLVFSLGLATTLTTVGLVFLYFGKVFSGSRSLAQNRLVKALPIASAFVVSVLGAAICYSALG